MKPGYLTSVSDKPINVMERCATMPWRQACPVILSSGRAFELMA